MTISVANRLDRVKIVDSQVNITLSQGYTAVVDLCDYEVVKAYVWHVLKNPRNVYARNGSVGLLHRFITKAGVDQEVDHKDGNGLNNARSNLRLCSHLQNQENQKHVVKPASSRYKGVSWHAATGKWMAKICVNYRINYLGVFCNENEAAHAYNSAATQYFGEFAKLNVL